MRKLRRDPMPPGWYSLRKQILVRDDFTCYLCGKYANTVDHLRPMSKGGAALDPLNLAACCRPCNDKKHTTWHDHHINTIHW
jgi:5-methylcytosine-specific restriction endonuclease McrA